MLNTRMKHTSDYRRSKSIRSDYKKDIINLIGIDFEAIPTDGLKHILHKGAAILSLILNKHNSLSQNEAEEVIKVELGITNKAHEKSEKIAELAEKREVCKAFRENYWKKRKAEVACDYRTFLGTLMSKKLVSPHLTHEAHAEMIKSVKKYFPFNLMNDDRIKLVVEAMSKLSIDAGEFLVKEDEFIEKFYYVQSGLLGTVVSSDKCYVTEYIKPGQCYGNEYLFFGGLSNKTIKCLQSATVWVLESVTFHSFCHSHLEDTYSFLEESISKTPGFDMKEATRLVNALSSVTLDSNTNVLAATPRCALYIVFTGKVMVKEVNVRGDEFMRTCEPGCCFGFDRLFTMRFAQLQSATTLTSVTLFYMTEEAFHNMFDVPRLYKLSDIEPYQDNLFYRIL